MTVSLRLDEVRVLGKFIPATYDEGMLREEFMCWVAQQLSEEKLHRLDFCIREPRDNASLLRSGLTASWEDQYPGLNVARWHIDAAGKCKWTLMWSNREQTEFQDAGPFEPFDVIIAGPQAKHRMPQVQSPDRWFARYIHR